MLGEHIADLSARGPGAQVDPVVALVCQVRRHEGVGNACQRRVAIQVHELQAVTRAGNDGGDPAAAGRGLGVGGLGLDHPARRQTDQRVRVRVVTQVHARKPVAGVVVRRFIGVQVEACRLELAVGHLGQAGEGPGLAWSQFQRAAREAAGPASLDQHAVPGLEDARADGQVEGRLVGRIAPAEIAFLQRHPTSIPGVEGVGADGHRRHARQTSVEGGALARAPLECHAGFQIGFQPFGVGVEVGDPGHRLPEVPE